ncbi:MAG TPA: carboxylesterase family protein [Caulobacteraceae bacterium]|jgi:para-nitrobenzyl esterase
MTAKWMAGLAALALIAGFGPARAEITQAAVTGGKVAGSAAAGVGEFKGIPFAAPPVGDLRWKAPQPVKPWSGVRQTTHFGDGCMQSGGGGGAGPGIPYSEDCLYLDVWTPAKAPGDKLPVIVWIYGGGFNSGATSNLLYDGANFAKRGVVFVSISYRVGPFGFLATPELSKENGHGSGNWGLLDQIAGLKWVQANVAKFGGDPSKVTILGHSAGGQAVSMLAASPMAKGLFRAVIAESGANFAPPQDTPFAGSNFMTARLAEANGNAWLESLGAHNLAEARALAAPTVEKAQRNPGAPRFWPSIDGYVLTGDQVQLYKGRRFNDTPILVGDVSDEGAAFGRKTIEPAAFESEIRDGYGKSAADVLAAYPHATPEQATRAATMLRSDTGFDWHQYTWARLETAYGKNKAWMYWFDKPSAANPNGSAHGQEVGYVFGNLGVGGRAQPTDADRALSARMQTYWVNFATRLDPNGPGLPAWPAFTSSQQQAMRFGVDPGPAQVAGLDKLKVLDAYYDWRRDGSN